MEISLNETRIKLRLSIFLPLFIVFVAINTLLIWGSNMNLTYLWVNILIIVLIANLSLSTDFTLKKWISKLPRHAYIILLLWEIYSISFLVSEISYGEFYDAIPFLTIVPILFFFVLPRIRNGFFYFLGAVFMACLPFHAMALLKTLLGGHFSSNTIGLVIVTGSFALVLLELTFHTFFSYRYFFVSQLYHMLVLLTLFRIHSRTSLLSFSIFFVLSLIYHLFKVKKHHPKRMRSFLLTCIFVLISTVFMFLYVGQQYAPDSPTIDTFPEISQPDFSQPDYAPDSPTIDTFPEISQPDFSQPDIDMPISEYEPNLIDGLKTYFTSKFSSDISSSRFRIWENIVRDSSLLGTGYHYFFEKNLKGPHNFLFGILAYGGYIGVLTFLLLFFRVLFDVFRGILISRDEGLWPNRRMLWLQVLFAGAVFVLGGMTEAYWSFPYFRLMNFIFWAVLGFTYTYPQYEHSQNLVLILDKHKNSVKPNMKIKKIAYGITLSTLILVTLAAVWLNAGKGVLGALGY